MSQVEKSTSAFVRAFFAILVLELEDMVVRLFRPSNLTGVHGDRWTFAWASRHQVSPGGWLRAERAAHQLRRAIVAIADGDAPVFWSSMPLEFRPRGALAKASEDERQRRITWKRIEQSAELF
jgi:hypothetical protein